MDECCSEMAIAEEDRVMVEKEYEMLSMPVIGAIGGICFICIAC